MHVIFTRVHVCIIKNNKCKCKHAHSISELTHAYLEVLKAKDVEHANEELLKLRLVNRHVDALH